MEVLIIYIYHIYDRYVEVIYIDIYTCHMIHDMCNISVYIAYDAYLCICMRPTIHNYVHHTATPNQPE